MSGQLNCTALIIDRQSEEVNLLTKFYFDNSMSEIIKIIIILKNKIEKT